MTLQSPEFISARYPVLCNASALAVSDFDVDGHLDLIVAGTDGDVTVRRGDGEGGFAELATTTMFSADRVHVADIDGDSAPDLVVIGPDKYSLSLSLP